MLDFTNVAISPTYFLSLPLPYFLEALTLFLVENFIIYILAEENYTPRNT